MSSDVSESWGRLGDLLIRRRIELDPRFSNRQTFVHDRHIEYKTASDIEKGRRDNYEAATLAAVELAYGLASGAIRRYVDGAVRHLEPQAAPDAPEPAIPEPEPPANDVAAEMAADVLSIVMNPLVREIEAEIARHPADAPAEQIFRDPVEKLIWQQRTKTRDERLRQLAAFRAATRPKTSRRASLALAWHTRSATIALISSQTLQ